MVCEDGAKGSGDGGDGGVDGGGVGSGGIVRGGNSYSNSTKATNTSTVKNIKTLYYSLSYCQQYNTLHHHD